MPKPAQAPADEATFRRLCRILGSTGTSERRKRKRGNALTQLKLQPAAERQELFAHIWNRETRKRRLQMSAAHYCRYFLQVVQVLSFLVITGLSLYQHSMAPGVLLAPIAVVTSLLNLVALAFSYPLSAVQRGMARLLLRQEVTQESIGYLVEMTEFPCKREQEHEEILTGALRHLTRLLPLLTQTDASLLDASHKKILRAWVVRAGDHLTDNKKQTLRGVDADFATAALVALSATDGWEETTKEARAARAAVQKLAAATPEAEPVNHRYVRELARESLPRIQTLNR